MPEAPRFPPLELIDAFMMHGKARLEYLYYSNSKGTASRAMVISEAQIRDFRQRIAIGEEGKYRGLDRLMWLAMKKHFPVGSHCAVMGSVSPWYEAAALEFGASRVTVVEYNPVISEVAQIDVLTPSEQQNQQLSFDVGISISSFEHDGLGQYGDPINPDGDLMAMANMKRAMKTGALLFFSVPVGNDIVVWNAHRVYGEARLPLLFEGWEVVETFGYSEELLKRPTIGSLPGLNYSEPLFVLRNC